MHYDPKVASVDGNSLGMWAPAAVSDPAPGVSNPRGTRPAITTVTIELPQGELQNIERLEDIHAEVVLSVFLAGNRMGGAPPPAPTPPGQTQRPILKGCSGGP